MQNGWEILPVFLRLFSYLKQAVPLPRRFRQHTKDCGKMHCLKLFAR
jgi:hypothetical protein